MSYPESIEGFAEILGNNQLGRTISTSRTSRYTEPVIVAHKCAYDGLKGQVSAVKNELDALRLQVEHQDELLAKPEHELAREVLKLEKLITRLECRLIYAPVEPGRLLATHGLEGDSTFHHWENLPAASRENFAELEREIFYLLTAPEPEAAAPSTKDGK